MATRLDPLPTCLHANQPDVRIIQKGIEDRSFREKILEHTQLWENGNQKINQFKMYDKLLIRKKYPEY